jgi:hypothetical protein
MLPDWPVLKDELQRAFMRALAHELRQRNFTRDVVSSPSSKGIEQPWRYLPAARTANGQPR